MDWAVYGPSYQKIGFLKAFFNCLSTDELRLAQNIITTTKAKDTVKQRPSWIGPNPPKRVAAAADKSVATLTEKVIPSVMPTTDEPAAINDQQIINWWEKYNKIFAIDCEFVSLVGVSGIDRQRAGTVAICNADYKLVYSKKVKRDPKDIDVNKHTIAINNIRKHDLINGIEEKVVRELIQGKLSQPGVLVITHGGSTDFRSLGLRPNDFDTFDLQSYFRRTDQTGQSTDPMSLRDIYFHYFQQDPQKGVHYADKDSISTMKIFLDGYTKDKIQLGTGHDRFDYETFDNAINLRKKNEKNEFYCNDNKTFSTNNCTC